MSLGHQKAGHRIAGDLNARHRNAGHRNAGDLNAGHRIVGHGTTGYRRGRPARLVARALAAARAWAAAGLMAAAITLALPSTTDASPSPPAPMAQTSVPAPGTATNRHVPGVTLAIASTYKVTVPPGTWVPVTLSVANRGTSDVRGEIVVQAPAAQQGLSTPGCLSNGPSTFTCLSAEDYSSSLAAGAPCAQDNVHHPLHRPARPGARDQKAITALPPDRTAGSGRIGPCRGNHRHGAGPGQRPAAGGLRTGSTSHPGRDRRPVERLGPGQVGGSHRCPTPAAVLSSVRPAGRGRCPRGLPPSPSTRPIPAI